MRPNISLFLTILLLILKYALHLIPLLNETEIKFESPGMRIIVIICFVPGEFLLIPKRRESITD